MWKRLLCTAILVHASFEVRGASEIADSYPSRPIRLVLGFPAGGAVDYLARVTGPKLSERFSQSIIIDNRPGAGSNIASEIVARASPDGYTLLFGLNPPMASSPSLYPKLGYDLFKDFSYVSRVASGTQMLLAHPSVSAKSVAELVAAARAKPKAIRYGSPGVASPGHLVMALLVSRTGMDLAHIPYKGGPQAVLGLVGGEVQIIATSVTAALQVMSMVQAKRLNALAVTSAQRVRILPDVPTVAESGVPGFEVMDTFGILAPTGTPAAVVKRLNAEIRGVLQLEDVKGKFAEQGLEAAGSTPDEWRTIMKADVTKWTRVIKDANIPPF